MAFQKLKTIYERYIVGVYPNFSTSERAARIICAITAFNLFSGAIEAATLQLNKYYVICQLFLAVPFCFIFHLLVNKIYTERIILTLVFISSISFSIVWFFSGGINGPGIGGAIFIFYCNLQIAPSKYRLLVSGNILLVVVVTLSLNYLHPNWVTEYPNTEGRYTD